MRKQNVAYLRVSTEAQTEKYGLDMQKQKILEYCDCEGIIIDRWYIDGGYSGSKLDRPEIQRLLSDAKRGDIGKVFVYKLDRLSRDTVDTLNLLNKTLPEYGVQLISMTEEIRTDNPMDKVMVTMNAAMNQYEREVIKMRMQAGMRERVKKGLWMGGGRVPWGYYYDRNDGILHPDPERAEMVRNAYKMYLDGYSCDNISKILGFKGERIVIQILNRKSNIGIIEYKGEEYKGLHEPIVDEEIFYRVQELMKKRSTNSYVNHDNMLTGLCWCGHCGARMRYQKWGKYHKIVCYSQQKSKDYMVRDPNCPNRKAFAEEIEDEVTGCFKRFALNIEEGQATESNAEIIESAIKKANAKIKKYYSLYAENESENLIDLIREEEDRVKELKKELSNEQAKKHSTEPGRVKQIKRVADVWDELTRREKNKALKGCIEKIIITKNAVEVHFLTI